MPGTICCDLRSVQHFFNLHTAKYAKKANPDVLVIIITGYASVETAIMAVKEGAYDYIRKPCKLEEIRN